ncbi:hypothetical protein [Aliiroseovarius sp. S253]|uniref:hypothetical protein n=1 Tax=Aliiroseovarius sp. S253 TaxID=3415133 RepID=UPI003C7BC37D
MIDFLSFELLYGLMFAAAIVVYPFLKKGRSRPKSRKDGVHNADYLSSPFDPNDRRNF